MNRVLLSWDFIKACVRLSWLGHADMVPSLFNQYVEWIGRLE